MSERVSSVAGGAPCDSLLETVAASVSCVPRPHSLHACWYASLRRISSSWRSISSGVPNSKPVMPWITLASSSPARSGVRCGRCVESGRSNPLFIHGCAKISLSVARRAELVTSMRDSRWRHSGLSHAGYSTCPRLILACSAGMFWSSNGTRPHTST